MKALLTLSTFGSNDIKLTGAKILQHIMVLSKVEVVDAQSEMVDCMVGGEENVSFVEKIMREIGRNSVPFKGLLDGGGGHENNNNNLAESATNFRMSLKHEQVKLLRCLFSSEVFAKQIGGIMRRAMGSYERVMKYCKLKIGRDMREEFGEGFGCVDEFGEGGEIEEENIQENILLISAVIEILGGNLPDVAAGASGVCKMPKSKKGQEKALEEITIVSETSPPHLDDLKTSEEKEIWKDAYGFGDALIVAFANGKTDVVPLSSVCIEEDPLPIAMVDFLRKEEGFIDSIVKFYKQVISLNETEFNEFDDKLKEIVTEEDKVLSVEHWEKNEISKKIEIEGTDRVELYFESCCKTADNVESYITIYKDDTRRGVWGKAKYSGDGASGNFPGVGRNSPLIINSNKFMIYYSGSHSNDSHALPTIMGGGVGKIGFSVKIKAHTVKVEHPPQIPPPLTHNLLNFWRCIGAKSLHSLLQVTELKCESEGELILALVNQSLRKLKVRGDNSSKGGAAQRPLALESGHPYNHNVNR